MGKNLPSIMLSVTDCAHVCINRNAAIYEINPYDEFILKIEKKTFYRSENLQSDNTINMAVFFS